MKISLLKMASWYIKTWSEHGTDAQKKKGPGSNPGPFFAFKTLRCCLI